MFTRFGKGRLMETQVPTIWDVLESRSMFSLGTYGLMILNSPLKIPPHVITALWKGAEIRVCADGGTDRWFDYVEQHKLETTIGKVPDIVCGDFDSIKPETKEYCKEMGAWVEFTPDQDYTDFNKSVTVMSSRSNKRLDTLLVLTELGDRIDQSFSTLNELSRINNLMGYPLLSFLLSSTSLTWLLEPGRHIIYIPQPLLDASEWCSILPYEPKLNSVSTTGLRWNLINQTVCFGGLVSSSNTYSGDREVSITTDSQIVWSMGISPLLGPQKPVAISDPLLLL